MSGVRFLSTLAQPPPGFESRRPTKRDLLSSEVALLLDDSDELEELVGGLVPRVRGVVVTLESPPGFEPIARWLWRLRVPAELQPHLKDFVADIMKVVGQGARLQDEKDLLAAELDGLRADLAATRQVYNEATARLQRKVAEVTQLNRDLDKRLKEQIAAQAERQRLEEQLRQSQKLEAVGHLAGGIAHDFNNLLVAILGHTELGIQSVEEDSPLREELIHVKAAAQRAAALTHQLLAFSRRQILEPVELDMAEVVDHMVEMLRRILGEDVELEVVHAPGPTTVSADRAQLEQVLLNLCLNARDAMPTGGTITIETGSKELDAAYCAEHEWATPGRYVTLRVEDTGHGMNEETVGRVFEPFFTTKALGEGTGLGLSVVYGIATQHGGNIEVSSRPGEGTSFLILLPAVDKEPAPTPTPEPVGPAPVAKGNNDETILLVEDDPPVRRLCQRILNEAGYTVLTAKDGLDAWRVLSEHEGEVHLTLIDIVMPQMGGLDLERRLRSERPELKCLFSSGYSFDQSRRPPVLGEGRQLLQKPFEPRDLLRKVREVLDKP